MGSRGGSWDQGVGRRSAGGHGGEADNCAINKGNFPSRAEISLAEWDDTEKEEHFRRDISPSKIKIQIYAWCDVHVRRTDP